MAHVGVEDEYIIWFQDYWFVTSREPEFTPIDGSEDGEDIFFERVHMLFLIDVAGLVFAPQYTGLDYSDSVCFKTACAQPEFSVSDPCGC